MDAGALIFGEVQGKEVLADFDFCDLRPEDHLHVTGGFEEGKNFDAERGEDDVGVLGAADGDAHAEPSEGEWNDAP